jgi:hypothetical protein
MCGLSPSPVFHGTVLWCDYVQMHQVWECVHRHGGLEYIRYNKTHLLPIFKSPQVTVSCKWILHGKGRLLPHPPPFRAFFSWTRLYKRALNPACVQIFWWGHVWLWLWSNEAYLSNKIDKFSFYKFIQVTRAEFVIISTSCLLKITLETSRM